MMIVLCGIFGFLSWWDFFQTKKISKTVDFYDVDYFFQNKTLFRPTLPREEISRQVIIRGAIIEVAEEVVCIKAPCFSIKNLYIKNISAPESRIRIGGSGQIISELKVDQICTVEGILNERVDFGRQEVIIDYFVPTKVVRCLIGLPM